MLCDKHPASLRVAVEAGVRPCTECGNLTFSDCQICAHCGTGYDECQHCRAPLNNGLDARELAAFKSPAAVLIRQNKLEARATFNARIRDAHAVRDVTTAGPKKLLAEQMAPLRLACEKACKPFRDKVVAVGESLATELNETELTSLQTAKVHPRLQQALEKCDAACLPHLEKYERDVKDFIAVYRRDVKPAYSLAKRQEKAAEQERGKRVRDLEREMQTLLYRSTRKRYILLDFLKKIIKRKKS